MCTAMLVDQSATLRRATRTIAVLHSSAQPDHCCTHNEHVSPHQLVQLARALSRNFPRSQTKRAHNRNKNCDTMTAPRASQLRGASVVTCPSFLAQSWQTSGGSRPLRYSSHGGFHVRRHCYATK